MLYLLRIYLHHAQISGVWLALGRLKAEKLHRGAVELVGRSYFQYVVYSDHDISSIRIIARIIARIMVSDL